MCDELRDSPDSVCRPGSLNPDYHFIRGRQLEGTYVGDKMLGVWQITGCRISRGWGGVTELDWPMRKSGDSPWPIPEPPGLDEKAKRLRSHHYQRVRSLTECLLMLGHGIPVQIAVEITDQWFDALNGFIDFPQSSDEIIDAHSVSVFGFDLSMRCLLFANSWGPDWGVQGHGFLPFAYCQKYVYDAFVTLGYGEQLPRQPGQGMRPGLWSCLDPIGRSLHGSSALWGVDIFDEAIDDRLGWAFVVQRDGYLEVEELFVKPAHRRKGIASALAVAILELAERERRRVRMWIPHGDWTPENSVAVTSIAAKLGLNVFDSSHRWASAVALDASEFDRPGFRLREPDFVSPVPADPHKRLLPRPGSVRRKKGQKKEKPRPGSTTSQTGPRKTVESENDE